MTDEIKVLFNYKGKDILIKKKGDKYCVGIRDKFDIWFEDTMYNTLELTKTSGRDYARIVIDKIIVSKKDSSQ